MPLSVLLSLFFVIVVVNSYSILYFNFKTSESMSEVFKLTLFLFASSINTQKEIAIANIKRTGDWIDD